MSTKKRTKRQKTNKQKTKRENKREIKPNTRCTMIIARSRTVVCFARNRLIARNRNDHSGDRRIPDFTTSRRLTLKSSWLFCKKRTTEKKGKKKKKNESLSGGSLRDQDLPLRDRRQGWKHEGQGAPRGRGASCCVSHFQLILSGRSTCSTLSGAPSPWRHDPDKFSDRLPRNAGRRVSY